MGEKISTRRKIYEEIVLNPGLHFRELQKRLDIPTGMLEYHLSVLEREGVIVSKMDGKYKRFFANTHMSRDERRIMGALRSEIGRRIVIFLLENGRSRHADMAESLGIRGSTLSYHLTKLVKSGIIGREEEGREVFYFVIDPEKVAATIVKYRKSFLDVLVDNFVRWYLSDTK